MTTHAQSFLWMLEDPNFWAAFEAAAAEERQCLLSQAGLLLSLREANAIFSDLCYGLNKAEGQTAAAGYFDLPLEGDEIP